MDARNRLQISERCFRRSLCSRRMMTFAETHAYTSAIFINEFDAGGL
jgi:hypothetical protein